MSQLAKMATELLCHLTFAPPQGHDPEDTATLVNSWWQTLINDLSPSEMATIRLAMQELASGLSRREGKLENHERSQLRAINSFLQGTMS